MKRLVATFDPQAWVRDYAVSVDPEGPQTWDCTSFLTNPPEGVEVDLGDVREVISEHGSWLDENDILKDDPNAPEWVREWTGPFTITVEEQDGEGLTNEQRNAAADALGYEVSDDRIMDAVEAFRHFDKEKLRRELRHCEQRFDHAGGRGVEAAEEIDSMRIALAVRI